LIETCEILPEKFFPITFSVRNGGVEKDGGPPSDIPVLDSNVVLDRLVCKGVPEACTQCISFSWDVGRFLLFLVNKKKRESVVLWL